MGKAKHLNPPVQRFLSAAFMLLCAVLPVAAQQDSLATIDHQELGEVTVKARRPGLTKGRGVSSGETLTSDVLTRAACCNLGESFANSPSVDVSYSDAATGARQIRLLGLSGTYVQMLTENIPNLRGVAAPFSLGYIPGPWLQSIQVSKGAASVKNGHESITGQINVEQMKPQTDQQLNANLYGNSMARLEANADGNIHLSDRWSMGLLLHYEDKQADQDHNHDTFMDEPNVRQMNSMLRWAYFSPSYIFQAGVRALKENRESGQLTTAHHGDAAGTDASQLPSELYRIGLETQRVEAFAKNAYIFNAEHNTNVALILQGTFHQNDSHYGLRSYDVIQRTFYGQLLFENDFTPQHNLSAGLSLNHDYYNEWYGQSYRNQSAGLQGVEKSDGRATTSDGETTMGAYAQYMFTLDERLTLMAGLRGDRLAHDRVRLTSRVHIKYSPTENLSLRVSAGKGHRWVHPLAENAYLLSSGRALRDYTQTSPSVLGGTANLLGRPMLEEAWNYGVSSTFSLPVLGRQLQLGMEYFYTHFRHQLVIDYDNDASEIGFFDRRGGYSHTFQVDATCQVADGLELMLAWRRNLVRSLYAGEMRDKPLQGKYKGLLTASYKTPLGKWQFDANLQLNGGGRLPSSITEDDGQPAWAATYPAFAQLSVQGTRWFRHFSVYVGGENLTGYRQKNPIVHAEHPWTERFEPTLVWGPVQGAMFYVGLRFNLTKYV